MKKLTPSQIAQKAVKTRRANEEKERLSAIAKKAVRTRRKRMKK